MEASYGDMETKLGTTEILVKMRLTVLWILLNVIIQEQELFDAAINTKDNW